MQLMCFTVYDKAVSAFMTPFFARSDAEAVRSFRDACSDTKHQFNMHASDYVLFKSGVFDDQDGCLRPLESPVKVVDAIVLVAPVNS